MNQITTGFEKLKKIVIGEKDSVKRFVKNANHSVNNVNNSVKRYVNNANHSVDNVNNYVKRYVNNANHSVDNVNNYVKKTFKKSFKRFNKFRKNRTFRKPWHIGKIRR
jgi:hypothetical protein